MCAPVPQRQRVILCVDDEPVGLKGRRLVLEHAGYSVLSTTDPDEAMQLFKGIWVDLVLVDHCLPEIPGIRLAAEMKRLRPDVKVVMLSGAVITSEDISGLDGFLCKAETPQAFLAAVANLLRTE